MIRILGITHVGRREHNEDCFIADSTAGLALVADGMGGYACGEIASALVKQTIAEAVANQEGLREAITRAHAVVKEAAKADSDKKGMGSTAIALRVQGLDYEIAWVGDSRAYLWDPAGVLKQITRDHSYVESLLSSGAISEQEALTHPNRNLITQAVGAAGESGLEIDWICGRLAPSQQLLLCSDGLVDELLDHDIARLIDQCDNQQQLLERLVKAALDAGGRDNITVVIAQATTEIRSEKPAIEPITIREVQLQPTVSMSTPAATADAVATVNDHCDIADQKQVQLAQKSSLLSILDVSLAMLFAGLTGIILLLAGLFFLA